MCDPLTIKCRGKSRGGRIFLIMNSAVVVAQIVISEVFLSEKTNPISKFKDSERIRSFLVKKAACAFKLSTVSDLIVGMNSINLAGEIIELDKPKSLHSRWARIALWPMP